MDAISFVLGESTKNLRVRKLSDLIHGAPINKPVGSRASVSLVFVLHDETKRFQRSIINNISEYRVNDRTCSSSEYNDELEKIGIISRAKNFLIFQGQVESIAMKTPKELTAMFEELSRSADLRDEYERARQEKGKAEQDTHVNFQKKKGVEKQKKEVRLEKEVAQKYTALKTQYVRQHLNIESISQKILRFFSFSGRTSTSIEIVSTLSQQTGIDRKTRFSKTTKRRSDEIREN